MKYNNLLDTNKILHLLTNHLNISPQSKGKSTVFLCPFHEDKKPSLSFEPQRKIFKCFSCNFFAANIFEFWAKFKKGNREITTVEFQQSLKEISKLGYFSLPTWPEKKNEGEKAEEKIANLFSFLTDIYQHNLFTFQGREILNYLQVKRRLSQKTIDRFLLGASISNKQITDLFLREKNDFCSSDDLLFTNLIQVNDNNQAYDYFVARQLIFPLHNEKGKIVAFAARKLEISPAESKYTYLSNHQLYHKSSLLYNYLPVRENRNEECYLVEGFFDVISLNQIGIENCLAILGTSLSTTHLLLLRELKKRIILFLDGDEAGREATINIAIKLLSQEIDCEVIEHDYQSDPDDICQQHDLTAVYHILRQRKNPYLFILNYYYEKWEIKDNPQRIARFIEKLAKIFLKFKENIHHFLIKKISEAVEWSEEEVENYFTHYHYPVLHISHYGRKIIQEMEERVISLCARSRKFWLITEKNNYLFWDPTNRKHYQIIYSYYLSSPHYKSFSEKSLVSWGLRSATENIDINYFFIKTNIIKQYINQVNNNHYGWT